jgi:hypothetical protein
LWCLDSFQLCLWLYVCWADSISTMIHIYTILWMESWPRREDRLACWPVWRDSYGFSPGGTNFFYLDLRNGSTQKMSLFFVTVFSDSYQYIFQLFLTKNQITKLNLLKTQLHILSPRANYTDRATTTCQQG